MEYVFWLVPDRVAGRCGPNEQDWDLAHLRASGIGAVLSVNDGELCIAEEFAEQGIAYACVPLSSNAPPCNGDLEHCLRALPEALSFAEENIRRGSPVLVHCAAGKDRTGLFLAYYLMRTGGISAREAMARVRAVRPIAFTADGWYEFAFEVLSAAERRR
jgi:protein-tyrosine phosphatase